MIKEIDIQQWQKYTEESLNDNPFLHVQWLLLLSTQYKLSIKILGYFENNTLISAIPFVEKKTSFNRIKLISLPFTDYISYVKELPDQFILLLKDYLSTKYTSVELRTQISMAGKSEPTFCRHYLNLDMGYEKIRLGYRKNTYRNIIKSAKNNLTFKISSDLKSIDEFYKLNILTRKKHGLPPQPKSFFINIFKYLFECNLGFVATVYTDNKAIAAAIFFTYKNTIIYKYGASDSKHLILRPNNFLFDSVLKYASDNKYSLFDFGICSRENTGLRRFKLGWGAKEEDISYVLISKTGIHPYNKKNYNKIVHYIFKTLPSKLNVLIGAILYKYAA